MPTIDDEEAVIMSTVDGSEDAISELDSAVSLDTGVVALSKTSDVNVEL